MTKLLVYKMLERLGRQTWLYTINTKPPSERLIMLISKFERKEFFNHKFSANDLFNRLYNVSHRKSPPTCFILLKTVLGLIAKDEDIKVVGMLQSVLAAEQQIE
ncbi:unnamed protein product [Rhizophagus irregularis]|nr:unnamed protein product [Rhizophagus irregularis]